MSIMRSNFGRRKEIMYLERIVAQDGKTVEDKFNELSNEQQISLMDEIKNQKDLLSKSKIVAETNLTSLKEKKEDILKELKDSYGLNSIEEAENKVNEINDEIISALKEFAEGYQSVS